MKDFVTAQPNTILERTRDQDDREEWLLRVDQLLHAPARRQQHVIAQVIPGFLYLGGLLEATDLPLLEGLGISGLVNTAASCCVYEVPEGWRQLALDAADSPTYPLLNLHLEQTVTFLDRCRRENRRALVHCFAGINRSAALCAAYMVVREGMDLLRALHRIRRLRGPVLTNVNFRRQLVELAHSQGKLLHRDDSWLLAEEQSEIERERARGEGSGGGVVSVPVPGDSLSLGGLVALGGGRMSSGLSLSAGPSSSSAPMRRPEEEGDEEKKEGAESAETPKQSKYVVSLPIPLLPHEIESERDWPTGQPQEGEAIVSPAVEHRGVEAISNSAVGVEVAAACSVMPRHFAEKESKEGKTQTAQKGERKTQTGKQQQKQPGSAVQVQRGQRPSGGILSSKRNVHTPSTSLSTRAGNPGSRSSHAPIGVSRMPRGASSGTTRRLLSLSSSDENSTASVTVQSDDKKRERERASPSRQLPTDPPSPPTTAAVAAAPMKSPDAHHPTVSTSNSNRMEGSAVSPSSAPAKPPHQLRRPLASLPPLGKSSRHLRPSCSDGMARQ
uniref:protein-tyrosine-phosphatase n=1 Tax=Chromera velia CCMP2878 TaxID=1169474 RepID=A0A0G4HH36_9ALVE|eukprot:Cvel_6778.t1-p1 / transcript=Cvel_6778.t1 / gene=Cvel_6778 / organism=Chromera_velia_CCMP2878 / gene_product=Dual specificity protein phosphatase 22, putative / transcript_product=Dual specificity protein phosphatase 22, putative / location=Cvel_scaffold340:55318-57773(+) / protein_length=556 / sequence_SO=supercontig / SO=protein_coding / is_pseudo=false